MMQDLEWGVVPTWQSEPNLPQADNIRINDMGPVKRAAGAFAKSNRCLYPGFGILRVHR